MAPPPRPRIEREAAAAAREAGEIDDECYKPRNSSGRSSFPYQQQPQKQQQQQHYNQQQNHNQRYSNHYHNNTTTNNHFQRRGGGVALPPRQSHLLSSRIVEPSNSSSISTSSYADLARADPPPPPSRALSSAASCTTVGIGGDSTVSHTLTSSVNRATNGLANRWQSTSKSNSSPPDDRQTDSNRGNFRATELSSSTATLAPRRHGSLYDEERSIDGRSDVRQLMHSRDSTSSVFGRFGSDLADTNSAGRRAGRWDTETRGGGGRRSFVSRGGNRSRGDGFRGRTGRYSDLSVYSSDSQEPNTRTAPFARGGEIFANRESFQNGSSSGRSFEFRGRGIVGGHRSGRGRFDGGASAGGSVSRPESPPTETLQALKRIRGPTNSFGSEGEILSDAEISPKLGTKPYWRQDNDDSKAPKHVPLSFERPSMPAHSSFSHSSPAKTKANESSPNNPIERVSAPQIRVPPSQPTVLRSYGSLAGDEDMGIVKEVPELGGQYSAMDRTTTDNSVVRDRSDFQRSSDMERESMTNKGRGWIDRRSNPDRIDVDDQASREQSSFQRSAQMAVNVETNSQGRGDWSFRGRGDRGRSGRSLGGHGFGGRGGEVGRRGGRFVSLAGGERAVRGRGYQGRGDFNRGDGGRGNRVISNRRSSPSDELESSWKTDQHYRPYSRDVQHQQPPSQPSFKSYADTPFFTPRDANVHQSGPTLSYFGSRPESPQKTRLSTSPPPPQFFASMSGYSLVDGVEKPRSNVETVVKTETMEEARRSSSPSPPPTPSPPPAKLCPPSPPPPAPKEPSSLVLAITRLADLEAQMEYEYAKHLFLARQQEKLRAEYKVLEKQPVGMESFQEEYDAYLAEQVSPNEA